MITVNIVAEEAILHLERIPRDLREMLKKKFGDIFDQLRAGMAEVVPLKYLDPKFVQSGTEELGSSIVGFIEADEKPGVYAIYPSKARVLRFISQSGEVVFVPKVLAHPFTRADRHLADYLARSKPWIVEQLEDSIKDL